MLLAHCDLVWFDVSTVLSPNGLELSRGPIIRDYLFYAVAVAMLIGFTEHLSVNWWEVCGFDASHIDRC
jgi:hypothetical protein